jgi:hypothetical protein
MAEAFDEEEREDLLERGFNNGQIEYLESLEIEGIYFDICKIMDDFGDTAEQIIESYREANNDNNNPQQGGRRRSKKNRKGRKGTIRKGRSRKTRRRKTRRRKSRINTR